MSAGIDADALAELPESVQAAIARLLTNDSVPAEHKPEVWQCRVCSSPQYRIVPAAWFPSERPPYCRRHRRMVQDAVSRNVDTAPEVGDRVMLRVEGYFEGAADGFGVFEPSKNPSPLRTVSPTVDPARAWAESIGEKLDPLIK